MDGDAAQGACACPVAHATHRHTAFGGRSNRDWRLNALNLRMLYQHSDLSNPMGEASNHAVEFNAPMTVH
jgi:catalase-peroxidase